VCDDSQDACLHQLFERQAARTPGAIAVVYEDSSLTYAALDARSSKLARRLQRLGVGPESLVGVFTHRSLDMIVALFGVLKAGAAYVPLDPGYPADRIAFMLDDSDVAVLLTQESLLDRLPAHGRSSHARTLCLDSERGWNAGTGSDSFGISDIVDSGVGPSSLAYVIYTSGSTGKPKGAAIEHRNAVAFVTWALSVYSREDVAVTLASASICFDFSIFELFVPLSAGGTVRLVENALSLEAEGAADGVTFINMVPSAMAELVRENKIPKSVRVINLGGEALPAKLAQMLYESTDVQRIVNIYGPTECTVCATFSSVLSGTEGAPSIGGPISGTEVYVLDDQGNLAPMGSPGELYIGGAGVGRGYLNRPALTAERFVPNPFSMDPGARLYRTGDLVRWRTDGAREHSLDFLGRLDHQVKLRGFRIELEEIESVLADHPSVRECVVVLREDTPGDQRLVGYVVAEQDGVFDPAGVREFLRRKLPEYMVPWPLVALEGLPRTESGKRSRKHLPAPHPALINEPCGTSAPEGSAEETLSRIWAERLKLQSIGIDDNFFELGGHSLLAIQLLSRVQQEFETTLSLAEMLKAPTIRAMSQLLHLKSKGAGAWTSLLTLQPLGDGPPLFCAPVGGGSAFYYRTLAAWMGSDRPVYSFEPIGMNGVDRPHDTVEEMAAYYVRHMRSVQPYGPYHLCGLSFGGVVAFEMAKQLAAEGEDVGSLILFDSQAAGDEDDEDLSVGRGLRFAVHKLRYMFSWHKESLFVRPGLIHRVEYVQSRLMKLERRLRDRTSGKNLHLRSVNPASVELPEAFEQVRLAEKRSRQTYRPGCYPGQIHLLRARVQAPEMISDPLLGWGGLARDITVIETPGTHHTILENPCIYATMKLVKRILARHDGVSASQPTQTMAPGFNAAVC